MFKKTIAGLLAALMVMGALVGCSDKSSDSESTKDTEKESGEEIVINYPTFMVGVNTSAKPVQALIDGFNEEYKGVYRIVKEEIPGDMNYVDKINVQLSTGDLPPVIYGGGFNLLDPVLAKDQVLDLTEYVNADPEWKALYSEAAMKANSRDGKIYASSCDGSLIGYYYNKDLFASVGIEEPAKTWDEFWKQCDTLKAAGITPLSMDTADGAWVSTLWMGAMVATSNEAGLELMTTTNPTDYNTPEMIAAAENVQKMFKEYTTSDAVGSKYENAANAFLSGETAMIANGTWMTGDFYDTTKAPEGFGDKVGTAVYPGNFVYDAPLQGYFATKQDDPKLEEAAIEMIRYFTSADAQRLVLEMQGMPPASPSIEASDEVKEKFPILADFLPKAESATVRCDNFSATMFPNIPDIVSQEMPRLATGEITPEQFCQALTDAAQKNV